LKKHKIRDTFWTDLVQSRESALITRRLGKQAFLTRWHQLSVTKQAFCTCNLNAKKMLEIYKRLCYHLPNVGSSTKIRVLHKDNDSKHRSKLCTEWKQQSGIVTLDWPSQLPDTNPIKNVLAYIKHKLRRKRTYTLKQLSREIRRIWRTLSLEYAVNLVESMPGNYRCRYWWLVALLM